MKKSMKMKLYSMIFLLIDATLHYIQNNNNNNNNNNYNKKLFTLFFIRLKNMVVLSFLSIPLRQIKCKKYIFRLTVLISN